MADSDYRMGTAHRRRSVRRGCMKRTASGTSGRGKARPWARSESLRGRAGPHGLHRVHSLAPLETLATLTDSLTDGEDGGEESAPMTTGTWTPGTPCCRPSRTSRTWPPALGGRSHIDRRARWGAASTLAGRHAGAARALDAHFDVLATEELDARAPVHDDRAAARFRGRRQEPGHCAGARPRKQIGAKPSPNWCVAARTATTASPPAAVA